VTIINRMNGMHPSNKISLENVKDVVYWHKQNRHQIERMEAIATKTEELLVMILNNCPECADRSVAISRVREARMWANSAIALESPEVDHSRGQ